MHKYLLVGSRALLKADVKYLPWTKRSWDTDIICTYDAFCEYKNKLKEQKIYKIQPLNRGKTIAVHTKESGIYEFEIAWKDSSAFDLLKLIDNNKELIVDFKELDSHSLMKDCITSRIDDDKYLEPLDSYTSIKGHVASPNLIFTLKKSHRFLRNSPHFLKTMLDYKHLRDNCGCEVPECLNDWYKKRVKETYWYKHPSLNQSKKDFFADDAVPYVYDHDSIHLAMAHLGKPAYEYFKEDKAEVKCSKDLFNELPEQTKLYAVLEESYVLALERSQIPAPGVWTPRKSFETALMKVASSITSGWFREYAYENYFKVLELYDDKYVEKFWRGVESGIVKKI